MKKQLELTAWFLLFALISCDHEGTYYPATLSDNVREFITEAKQQSEKNIIDSGSSGTFTIRAGYICDVDYYELRRIDHPSHIKEGNIYTPTSFDPSIFYITKGNSNSENRFRNRQILKRLPSDTVPINTAFQDTYLYVDGKSHYYSMVDSLIEFDSRDLLILSMTEYLGVTCY